MDFAAGQRWLVTTNGWFYAPDGRSYRGAYGTVKGVRGDEATLGIRTNRNATNWYLEIGNLLIAGCQIHYAVRTDDCNLGSVAEWNEKDGVVTKYERPVVIYNADSAEAQ